MTPDPREGDTPARTDDATHGDDPDLDAGDPLLGVPARELIGARALRGLAMLVLASAILLWPSRTDRALGVLAGIALAVYTVSSATDLVRHRAARTFLAVLAIGVSAGFAAALIVHPEDSLASVTQTSGAILVGLAVMTLVSVLRRQHDVSWGVSKSFALTLAGVLLIAFPNELLALATSVGAGLLAASGLIQAFTPDRPMAAGEPVVDDRTPGANLLAWIRHRPEEIEDRATLQEKIFFEGPTSPTRFARFAALMGFAAVIAAVGVVVESTAVVIGAMLIAPLMVPLMGTALALTMGWPQRARRCAVIALSGVGIGIALGALVGALSPGAVDVNANAEILARITPTTLDLAIAVAAGAAGAYALSRRDVSDSLPGVAVAIALVPPLTVAGLAWQQGEWAAGNGALLLFITNATAILVAGGATFVLIGVAPIRRISATQERLKTVIVALLSGTAIVIVLLVLNGADLTRTELARNDVDRVITSWTTEHEDFRLLDTRVLDDGTIVVDLAGPGPPPDLPVLLADFEDSVDGADVRVTWVEQQEVTVEDGG